MNEPVSIRTAAPPIATLIGALVLGGTLVAPIEGQTHLCVEPSSGLSGTLDQVQSAIDTVRMDPLGGSVTIMPGIYTPGLVAGIVVSSPPVTPAPAVVIQGGGPFPSQTVLDGAMGNVLPVISVAPGWGSELVILNLRIQRGGNFHDGPGGSIGGGISVDASSPQIIGNEVLCNVAHHGGGIGCSNGASPLIADNLISLNGAKGAGGGVYFDSSEAELRGNIISRNSAYDGGGVHASGGRPFLWQNVLEWNDASQGGGLSCAQTTGEIVFGNIVRLNTALGPGGGAAMIDVLQMECLSNVFSENTSFGDGGGLFIEDSSILLMHQTIRANTAFLGGGMSASGSIALYNSIVWDNSDQSGAPHIDGQTQQFTIRHCDIEHATGDHTWLNLDPLTTFSADPMFMPAAPGGRLDHHIQFDSPCRDQGLVDATHPNGEWDVDLDPRVPQCAPGFDLGPDIGADEFFTTLYVEDDQTGSYATAELISGSTVRLRIIGEEGHVAFLGGSSALTSPATFPLCSTEWRLDPSAPGAFFVELAPIPVSGLLDIEWTVPDLETLFAMQVAVIDPQSPHPVIASNVELFLFLPTSESHPEDCNDLDNVEITPIQCQ